MQIAENMHEVIAQRVSAIFAFFLSDLGIPFQGAQCHSPTVNLVIMIIDSAMMILIACYVMY
jgi:membrane protein DedA with SNARE-associated domain